MYIILFILPEKTNLNTNFNIKILDYGNSCGF
jgi:hypothetical protein